MSIIDIKDTPTAVRYDQGKTRHDLTPAFAQEEYAKVLTFGAKKYAAHNWRKGMDWSKVIASLERHLIAFKSGQDVDPESGCLHTAQIMCNAAFLTEYQKIHLKGDDRALVYSFPRVGFDVDEVLADFTNSYCKRFNVPNPSCWSFDEHFEERYSELQYGNEEFWTTLPMILSPDHLPVEPTAYITARPESILPSTIQWLNEHGYPLAPVYSTTDKLTLCKELQLDVFVDDKYETFKKLNANGILCYLFDSAQNQRYNVGWKRVNKDTIQKILL
jgi:uncharacterized HAD superfamily protein